MSIPTRLSSVVARQASRQTLPAARAPLAVQQQKRTRADASTSHAEFKSPFTRGTGNSKDTTVIPSFKKYKNGNETTNKVFQYRVGHNGYQCVGWKSKTRHWRNNCRRN
jgi:ubiquinol-cytochrome c reductase iron-sulfur subunit